MEAVSEGSKPDIELILGGMTLLTPDYMFDLQQDLLAIFNPILTFFTEQYCCARRVQQPMRNPPNGRQMQPE